MDGERNAMWKRLQTAESWSVEFAELAGLNERGHEVKQNGRKWKIKLNKERGNEDKPEDDMRGSEWKNENFRMWKRQVKEWHFTIINKV